MSRGIRYFAIALTLVILLYSMALLKIVPGLELLLAPIPMITGKDLSFTGRTEIWALVLEHIQRRPLLGSGYGAYWVVGARPTPDQESYSIMGALNGFYPGNSHNGYLDVLNDLGAIGLLCLLGYLIVFLRQSLRLCGTDRQQGALYLALLLQQAIINLSEARFFNNTIFVDFALMSFATTCLARDLLEARIPARPAPVPAPRHLAPGRAPKPPPSRLLVRPRQR
jgi:O-antigen ligase